MGRLKAWWVDWWESVLVLLVVVAVIFAIGALAVWADDGFYECRQELTEQYVRDGRDLDTAKYLAGLDCRD